MSKTRIELHPMFKRHWDKGYLVTNKENRRNVILTKKGVKSTTVSYARYLMSIKLGYFISSYYHVDHIDEDKTNDDPNNLQLLTPDENRKKYNKYYKEKKQKTRKLLCPFCGKDFVLTEREYNNKKWTAKRHNTPGLMFCSKGCSINYYFKLDVGLPKTKRIRKVILPEWNRKIKEIKLMKEHGKSSYEISRQLEVARNTVMKYWK